jgi:hypothetical protein
MVAAEAAVAVVDLVGMVEITRLPIGITPPTLEALDMAPVEVVVAVHTVVVLVPLG